MTSGCSCGRQAAVGGRAACVGRQWRAEACKQRHHTLACIHCPATLFPALHPLSPTASHSSRTAHHPMQRTLAQQPPRHSLKCVQLLDGPAEGGPQECTQARPLLRAVQLDFVGVICAHGKGRRGGHEALLGQYSLIS